MKKKQKNKIETAAAKEYPMPADYLLAVERLTKKLAERDQIEADIKRLPPKSRPKHLAALAEFDKRIEDYENSLAEEYDLYQKKYRLEEKYEAKMTELSEMMDEILADMKIKDPELYEKITASFDEIEEAEAETTQPYNIIIEKSERDQ